MLTKSDPLLFPVPGTPIDKACRRIVGRLTNNGNQPTSVGEFRARGGVDLSREVYAKAAVRLVLAGILDKALVKRTIRYTLKEEYVD